MGKIKVAQYGCGKMSVYTMRYACEKGMDIVCAFDVDENIVGKDIGEIIGCEPKGIKVQHVRDAESLLGLVKPDICIITTMSLFRDVYDAFMICARLGIDAISTCEEAFFPWNSSPQATAEIDKMAKKKGCTICGSGYQDVFWGNLITTLAGASHVIRSIKGVSSYNVEDYGIALARAHGAGLSLEEFEREIATADSISEDQRQMLIERGEFLPSYMWNVNGWLCSQLGLHVKRQLQKCVPQTCEQDLYSQTLDMRIPAGHATGMAAIVTTETMEGITLESQCIGKVYSPEEFDKNDWTIVGEPETRVVIERPCTVELTCATVINRIPDVMNSPCGFITTEKMPVNKYRLGNISSKTR